MVTYYSKFLLTYCLCITAIVSNAQSIQNVSPSTISKGDLISVTISGQSTNFTQVTGTMDLSLYQFSQSTTTINPVSITVNNDNEIVAGFRIPNCFPTGSYSLGVFDNADGFLSLAAALTLTNDPTPPTITNVSPSSGTAGNTLNVTISGQNTNFSQVTNVYQVLFSQLDATAFNTLVFEQSSSTIGGQLWFSQASPTGFDQVWFGQSSSTSFFPNSINAINNTTLEANVTIPLSLGAGNYNVSIYNEYDCILHKVGTIGVTPITSKSATENESLSVYPNPFLGSIYIETKDELFSGDVNIKMVDGQGKVILTKHITTPFYKLNTESLESGIYTLLIIKNGAVYSKKIVKE